MMIAIKVMSCRDGDAPIHGTPPRKLLCARAFLPGGQEFMSSRILEGHDPRTQSAAVRQITEWLDLHRPSWDICIDGPVVQIDDDERIGTTDGLG